MYQERTRLTVLSIHDQVVNLVVEGWPHLLMLAGPEMFYGPASLGLPADGFDRLKYFLRQCKQGWFEQGAVTFCAGSDELVVLFGDTEIYFGLPDQLAFDKSVVKAVLPKMLEALKSQMASCSSSVLLGINSGRDYFSRQIEIGFPQLAASLLTGDKQSFMVACDSLSGLGRGSTPTGDDLIHGALVAFRYFQQSRGVEWYPPPFSECMLSKTTVLGKHMLELGRRGLTPQPVKEFLESLFEGEFSPNTLRLLGRMGASTGYDIAAAIVYLMSRLCDL